MVGMSGFSEAVKLAKENGLLGSIGIHLNVTEGSPKTDNIRRIPSFVDQQSGQFSFSISSSCIWMPSYYVVALREEFSRQIEMCITEGITPTHIDSHHHIHNIWPIGRIVIDVAHKYRIPFIRIARNIGRGIGFAKWMFKKFYNVRLRMHGLNRTDFMGSPSDYIYQPISSRFRTEIMVHPRLAKDNITIIDSYEDTEIGSLFEKMKGIIQ